METVQNRVNAGKLYMGRLTLLGIDNGVAIVKECGGVQEDKTYTNKLKLLGAKGIAVQTDEGGVVLKGYDIDDRSSSIEIEVPDYITRIEPNMFDGVTSDIKLIYRGTGIKSMDYVFNGYRGKYIDLADFNTSNVKSMRGLFLDCKLLKGVNLSNFSTRQVVDMGCMFDGCDSLETLDLSGFDTSKVKDMQAMFQNCKSLRQLNLSSFHSDNVDITHSMFSGCTSLESIDLSNFCINKVRSVIYMFYRCSSLKKLNLLGIDIEKANSERINDMFDANWLLDEMDIG